MSFMTRLGKAAKCRILIDAREKCLPASLCSHIGPVTSARLQIGDLRVLSWNENAAVIEMKSMHDLIASYAASRLQRRLANAKLQL